MKKLIVLIGCLALAAACGARPPNDPRAANAGISSAPASAPANVAAARALYPDLAALYGGPQGIYRSCAQNQGVCHNDKEHPNLATLGAVVQNIGVGCNLSKLRPHDMHDLCERQGDRLVIGDEKIEIASIGSSAPKKKKDKDKAKDDDGDDHDDDTSDDDPAKQLQRAYYERGEVRLKLRAPLQLHARGDHAKIMRDGPRGGILLGTVELIGSPPGSTDARLVDVRPTVEPDDPGNGTVMQYAFARSQNDPRAVHVGDPNEDGTYGAELGGALISPGRPDKSYIITRLTDPSAGPLMPRANCCSWTKASLRAFYCWIAGLRPDGKNALEKIDYDHCPAGPKEDVVYPEPGPQCETSGMCPVSPRAAGPSDATWTAVRTTVLSRCGGGSCHTEAAAGGLDLRNDDVAYRTVSERIVPRAPDRSELFIRINPDLCKVHGCTQMPLRKPALDQASRDLVRRWIERGAPRD
jgi:hypothetical protein